MNSNNTVPREIDYNAIIVRMVNTYQEQLTDWELEFISSVYEWSILNSRPLTEKQKAVVLKINAKMLGRSNGWKR